MIHASPLIVALIMLIASIGIGCYLGSLKSIILDVFAGILMVFIVFCVVLSFHLF
jgi:uncharacterized membrane protein YhaH (DUF805 family)